VEWLKPTDIISGNLIFREKTGESGMLKSFCSYYRSSIGMKYDNLELARTDDIYLVNDNLYFNTGWSGMVGEKWMLNTGIAGNYDKDNTKMSDDRIDTEKLTGSFKTTLTDFVSDKILIRFGTELNHHTYDQDIVMDAGYNFKYSNDLLSGFAESEISLSKKIALRIGGRSEYNSYSGHLNFVPRLSTAYKTGKHSQVSAAMGKFFQNPGDDYLKITGELSQESSVHYILNYQYSHNFRTFRIEAYYKDYSDLVRYSEKYSINPEAYTNSGYGMASGFDIFWRDQSTFNNTDYWISYSYLDSERKYLDFPESVTPGFASAHNLSVVYKRYIPKINSFFGITYTYASGRPYHDPNTGSFMSGRTRPYHDISFNFTYVTSVFKQMAVIHLMANNIPGFENIYGYNFSSVPDGEGRYVGRPIISPIRRQIVLAFIVMK
ncbi:MAG TPA: TonB-dependent receptor, partial [Cyclobacteriaceae bacterium]|nr:TonB-dependent receptor [Cyclobacteriaceae bacterium]